MVPAARLFHMMNCLGQGGFGVVYRATMQSPSGLRSTVAVKLLKDPTPDALRRLRKEGRLLAALTHPAILRVHDRVTLAGRVALVMEFIDGKDLTDLIRPPDPMPPRAMVEVIGTVAEALDAAWATRPPGQAEPLQLVHRDIKPSNLRIGSHGEVKVLDFGIAWADEDTQGGDGGTRGTAFIGSIPYMAPERFGQSTALAASDVYALGCTLFEGLAQERLHEDVTLLQMAQRSSSRQVHDAYVEQRLALYPAWPLDLVHLLRDMLAYRPEDRPTAHHVATLCEPLVDAMPGLRLKAWARLRRWEQPADASGPLSGQAISEGGLETSSEDYTPFPMDLGPAPPHGVATTQLPAGIYRDETGQVSASDTSASVQFPPRRRPVVEIIGAVLVLGLLVGAVGWIAASSGNSPPVAAAEVAPVEVPPAALPASAPPPVVAAPPTAPVIPPAVAVEAPAAPEPKPTAKAPRPAPREAVVTPPPVVVAPPPAAPVATPVAAPGRFEVVGDVTRIELRGPGGSHRPGATVPAGTYRAFADFGGGTLTDSQLQVDVPSGGTVRVRCNLTKWTCESVR